MIGGRHEPLALALPQSSVSCAAWGSAWACDRDRWPGVGPNSQNRALLFRHAESDGDLSRVWDCTRVPR